MSKSDLKSIQSLLKIIILFELLIQASYSQFKVQTKAGIELSNRTVGETTQVVISIFYFNE